MTDEGSGALQGDVSEKALEKFSEEAYKAGLEACRDVRELMSKNPDLVFAMLDTLPGLIDNWAYYTVAYIESVSETEKLRELLDNLPSIVLSLVSSVYGAELGVPIAALLLIPAGPLTAAIAKCGYESKDPVVEPASPLEARLRATVLSAQASVYRVYFSLVSAIEEEEEAGSLWRPREARLLYM